MKYFKYLLPVVIAAMLVCCTHQPNSSLTRAELLMNEAPDSALLILDTLSLSHFKTQSDRALYSMLYTEALDKNHLNPTNDSLISIAVDYFRGGKNREYEIISTYYQGRVRYLNKDYHNAILSFFKAKELAETEKSYFWAGMACRGISDIYNQIDNTSEELAYAKKEYEYTKKSGKQPYINYAMLDLGRAFYNIRDKNKTASIAESLIDSALSLNDANLYYEALHLKASNLVYHENYDEAYEIFSEICKYPLATTEDSLHLSLLLLEKDRPDESNKLLNQISDANAPRKSLVKYKFYKKIGKSNLALNEAEFLLDIVDHRFESSRNNAINTLVSNYYELNRKVDKAELQASKMKLWLIIVFSLLLFIAIVSAGLILYFRQKHIILEKVVLAQELQESLSIIKEENSTASDTIKSLLSSQYEMLENFSEIILNSSDTKVARKKIADAVTSLIDQLSIRSDKIEELEHKVDKLYNNLFSDFKKDLPGLKEVDYRLFLFSVLKISNPTISLFLKENKIEAVYNRRRHLKDKIKLLPNNRGDRYLQYLS